MSENNEFADHIVILKDRLHSAFTDQYMVVKPAYGLKLYDVLSGR